MAIREYSFKGWDLCGSLTLQPVTSNSAYRNRVCVQCTHTVHITSIELTVHNTSSIYTKKIKFNFGTSQRTSSFKVFYIACQI